MTSPLIGYLFQIDTAYTDGQVENSETSENDFSMFPSRVFVYDIGYVRKLGRSKLGKYFPRFRRFPRTEFSNEYDYCRAFEAGQLRTQLFHV